MRPETLTTFQCMTGSHAIRLIDALHVLDRQWRRHDKRVAALLPGGAAPACFVDRFSGDLGGLAGWAVALRLKLNRNAMTRGARMSGPCVDDSVFTRLISSLKLKAASIMAGSTMKSAISGVRYTPSSTSL